MTTLHRVAVRNLALLHREATPEAIRAEVQRLGRANNLEGCRSGFLADMGRGPA